MKSNILISLIFLICSISFAQKNITWEDLEKVEFEKKYFPEQDEYFLFPHFSPSVMALDGKTVSIAGYFLDVDPQSEMYILSKGPMSSCFFCGVGGPETAIELHFASKPFFKTDDIITVTGTLQINSDDVNHFNYIIKNAKAD